MPTNTSSWEILAFYLPIHFFYYLQVSSNIYKVEQDSLYFFLEGGFNGIYFRERNFTLSYVVSEGFLKVFKGSTTTFHGEALGILYNQTFFLFGPGIFIR